MKKYNVEMESSALLKYILKVEAKNSLRPFQKDLFWHVVVKIADETDT